jgi:hypothetical protein
MIFYNIARILYNLKEGYRNSYNSNVYAKKIF